MFYKLEVISTTLDLNICRQKPFKVNSIDISEHKFMPVILFKIANWSDCLKCKKSLNEHIQITFIISLRYCTLTACTVIGWFSSRYSKIGTACLHALFSSSIQFARDNCNNHLANLFFSVIKRYLLTLN